jgi:hypothetical protein
MRLPKLNEIVSIKDFTYLGSLSWRPLNKIRRSLNRRHFPPPLDLSELHAPEALISTFPISSESATFSGEDEREPAVCMTLGCSEQSFSRMTNLNRSAYASYVGGFSNLDDRNKSLVRVGSRSAPPCIPRLFFRT